MVKEMTEMFLRSAYAGESQAHMRYLIYADRAGKSAFPNVARLFTAVAYAEKVHASNHYKCIVTKGSAQTFSGALFGSRNSSEDLQAGIDGENFEINEMYPVYKAAAQFQGERAAENSFSWALEAEKVHVDLYQRAKQAVDQGKDIDVGPVHICSICGFTVEGDAPERCPVCNARRELFVTFA